MKQSGTTFDWLENYSTIRGIVNEHLVRPRYERHVAELVGRAEEAWRAAAAAAEAARLASASVRKDEAAQKRHFAEPVTRAFPRRKTVSGLAKVGFTL